LGQGVFSIFGGTFPRKDGTAEGDFVHISDVVDAISKAMNFVATSTGSQIVNVGSGQTTSVQTALEEVSDFLKIQIYREVTVPREGDAYSSFADIS
jgi:UDP-glucose 4-epimerase